MARSEIEMTRKPMKVHIRSTPGGAESWRIFAENDNGDLLPVSIPENDPITIRCEDGLIKASLTLIIESVDVDALVEVK